MTEATYLRKVLETLTEKGFWIIEVEGVQRFKDTTALTKRPALAVIAAQEVEDCMIYVTNGEKTCGIRVVWQGMGGEAEEVICDYSMTLDPIISSIEAN